MDPSEGFQKLLANLARNDAYHEARQELGRPQRTRWWWATPMRASGYMRFHHPELYDQEGFPLNRWPPEQCDQLARLDEILFSREGVAFKNLWSWWFHALDEDGHPVGPRLSNDWNQLMKPFQTSAGPLRSLMHRSWRRPDGPAKALALIEPRLTLLKL